MKIGKSWTEVNTPHRWFAWYPIWLADIETTVWLRWVWRFYMPGDPDFGASCWNCASEQGAQELKDRFNGK
jgi:hypothetical protein